MLKTLKFAGELVPRILSGEKQSTWRLWDDKDLKEGDIIQLMDSDKQEVFSQANITHVKTTTLGALNADDKKGHESFDSDQAMYDAYTRYYNKPVDEHTEVKIVWFRLVRG